MPIAGMQSVRRRGLGHGSEGTLKQGRMPK